MAKVYVGTYNAYNNGSLRGGWLDLANYASYGDFLKACKSLHRNESDPEFMIQDYEGFPDGLSCMEWLSEQDFNDVKAAMQEDEKTNLTIVDYSEKAFAVIGDTKSVKDDLKKLGGRFNGKLSCGAGWIFSNKMREEVEKFIGGSPVSVKREEKINKFTEWKKEFLDTQCNTPSDVKYYGSGIVGAIKFGEHFMLIDKPRIENKFCFHDEGPDYEFYKTLCADDKKMQQYFVDENESEFTNKIERIEKGDEVRIKDGDYRNQCYLYIGGHYYDNVEGRIATEEEKALILEGLKFGLAQFRKRLESYLKKYGLSKLHTWTYWADA